MSPARTLQLFDSLTRRTKPLPCPREIFGFYFCGPTVYGRAHIGNFRALVCADLLARTLKVFGYPLKYVRNITDVDDKTIRGAQAGGVSLSAFTAANEKTFHADCKVLALVPPDEEPRATRHIEEMKKLVEQLLKSKHAYIADDGSVYYRIDSFKDYGCLAHLDREGQKPGARVAQDEYEKESVADFVLWKRHKPEDGDVQWDSPWGPGRPGWHLECSAMSMKYLGESYELHGGGIDLLFPHHDNEIAQSEGATGKTFVKHWWHVAHLFVDGRKMSKSLGNLYTLDDAAKKGFTGREIRYALISAHYRENLNFTWEGVEAAREALSRLDNLSVRLHEAAVAKPASKAPAGPAPAPFEQAFLDCLANDLNISGALGELFTVVRQLNAAIDTGLPSSGAQAWLAQLKKLDVVLGIGLGSAAASQLPDDIALLVRQRDDARKAKNWSESDRLRNALTDKGWVVEDTSGGTRVLKR